MLLLLLLVLTCSQAVLSQEKCDCDPDQKCSDQNACPADCPSNCQPTCGNPDPSGDVCNAGCLPSGCVCRSGYILDNTNGTCIKTEECPSSDNKSTGCKGDPNAVDAECSTSCPPTCAKPNTSDQVCTTDCNTSGCKCKDGYILSEPKGNCILLKDCSECNGDPNAVPNSCPSSCPPTCDEPSTEGKDCIAMCNPSGCECRSGYILDSRQGKCVKPEECPAAANCDTT